MNRSNVQDITEELKSRKRSGLLRRLRPLFILAGLAVVTGVVIWLVWFSNVLVIKHVRIEGSVLTTRDQIIDTADVPIGTQIVKFDSGPAEERLTNLAKISKADISISWPSTVVITVEERELLYHLRQDGLFGWVDHEGVIFHTTKEPRSGKIVAQLRTPDVKQLSQLAKVIDQLPEELAKTVAGIKMNSSDGIEMELIDKRRLIWGDSNQTELKAQVAKALLKVKAKVIDVSAPEHPTTR